MVLKLPQKISSGTLELTDLVNITEDFLNAKIQGLMDQDMYTKYCKEITHIVVGTFYGKDGMKILKEDSNVA